MKLLLTIEDVAELLSLSKVTIEHWAYRRRPAPNGFPAPLKIARRLRWRESDFDAWISNLSSAQLTVPDANLEGTPTRRRPGRPRKTGGAQ